MHSTVQKRATDSLLKKLSWIFFLFCKISEIVLTLSLIGPC